MIETHICINANLQWSAAAKQSFWVTHTYAIFQRPHVDPNTSMSLRHPQLELLEDHHQPKSEIQVLFCFLYSTLCICASHQLENSHRSERRRLHLASGNLRFRPSVASPKPNTFTLWGLQRTSLAVFKTCSRHQKARQQDSKTSHN